MTLGQLAAEPPALPMSTAWLLNDIAEAKGKQELFTRPSPQVLKALHVAQPSSAAGSSTVSVRASGIGGETPPQPAGVDACAADGLRPLVLGNSKPRDRSEQEVGSKGINS